MEASLLEAGRQVLLDPIIWLTVIAAAFYGVFLGAMPGLTATMGVALFVPLTFWLDPLPALAAIVTMVACAIFAGDIPTALVRMPGTPASAAYADEAFDLSRRGLARPALGTMLWFSVTGGLFGAIVLMLLGSRLAGIAAWFSVAEYFWLYLMGLSCAVIVGGKSIPKSLCGLLIGLMFSTVGLSAVHTEVRFAFGRPELFQGINFIPAMIGLFGLSEVFRASMRLDDGGINVHAPSRGSMIAPAVRMLFRRPAAWVRSSTIGAVVGVLPGAGADIASWVSTAVSKRRGGETAASSDGATPAIADACAANSASLAGAWIPALVFGIPGDSITAIVIGVLYMKNIKPGPEIFEAQGTLVLSLYMVFLLANLVLLPVGMLAVTAGDAIMRIPRRLLLPVIVLFCIVGAYAVGGSLFDVGLMFAFGLLGLVCERFGISIGAMVLGMILGGPLEERFVQTLSGGGSLVDFVNRPPAAVLAIVCAGLWLSIALTAVRGRTHRSDG